MKIINNVFKVLENERWTMLFDAVIVVINVFFCKGDGLRLSLTRQDDIIVHFGDFTPKTAVWRQISRFDRLSGFEALCRKTYDWCFIWHDYCVL